MSYVSLEDAYGGSPAFDAEFPQMPTAEYGQMAPPAAPPVYSPAPQPAAPPPAPAPAPPAVPAPPPPPPLPRAPATTSGVFGFGAPPAGAGLPPAPAPPAYLATAAPAPGGQTVQGFSEPGYFAALGMRRRDVQKLLVLSLMVTLGIAVHWVTVSYYDTWLQTWGLSPRQEFLLRVSYPLALLFAMWNLKTFGSSPRATDGA